MTMWLFPVCDIDSNTPFLWLPSNSPARLLDPLFYFFTSFCTTSLYCLSNVLFIVQVFVNVCPALSSVCIVVYLVGSTVGGVNKGLGASIRLTVLIRKFFDSRLRNEI